MGRIRVLADTKFRMADSPPQKSALEGKEGGGKSGENHDDRNVIFPCGAKTKDQESSNASKTDEVEKRGGFFCHILVHFGRNVPLFIQRGFDLAHFKPGMSRLPRLHDHRGNEVGQDAEGKAEDQNGVFTKKETGKKNRWDQKNQGDGKMVGHHMQVFGGEKVGDHSFTMGVDGALSN